MRVLLIIAFLTAGISHSQTTELINSELQKVNEYIIEKNYAQGLSTLNTLLQQNPNDSNIYRKYAELMLELHQYSAAVTNIEKAILLSKNNPSNYLVAGNIYRAEHNYESAQEAYSNAIKIAPGMGEAYTDFALLNLQHYFMHDAGRLAELAYHYNPDSWQNVILRAKIAQQNGFTNEAQNIFLEGIKDFPYNEQLLDAFAQYYIDLGQNSKAVVILEEANSRFGESLYRNQTLAENAFRQKQYELAAKYYEILVETYKILKLPPDPLAEWRLYIMYNMQGEPSAERLLEAFEYDPQNQLYISALYAYLMDSGNEELKISLSRYLAGLSAETREMGINYYYLSLLKKITALNPADNKARAELINYAKIIGSEFMVQEFLEESLKYEPNNKFLEMSLEIRDYLSRTRRLNLKKRPVYQYTNKIFIEDNPSFYSDYAALELQNLEFLFPNIYNQTELSENFAQESRTMFQTNTNFNTASRMYISNQTIYAEIFDKYGVPVAVFVQGFSPENLTRTMIAFMRYLSDMLIPVGYLESRGGASTFVISLGSEQGLKDKDIVAILDKNFNLLTTAEVESTGKNTATVRQLATPTRMIDLSTSYVVPAEYIPSLGIENNHAIKDITQVSRIRYPLEIKLSN